MKNVLITGGCGYLGSMLATQLINKGLKVTVIDNLMFKKQTLKHLFINKNFKFHEIDVRDLATMKKFYNKNDIIFPLAALVGAPLCEKNKKAAKEINEVSILNMAKYLSKDQRVIYPNTNSGYGISEKQKICDENTPLNPISLYGITKKRSEEAILERENSISLRLATVFGVGYRNRNDLLVNFFVYNALKFKKLEIFEPNFRRNYIHLRDIINAFEHCNTYFQKMKSNIYNVGLSKANLTKIELCKEIKKILKETKIKIIKNKSDPDKRDYFVSNKKIEETGWKPNIRLQDGIKELISAYSSFSSSDYDRNY